MSSASDGLDPGTGGGSEEQRQRGIWILLAAALAFAVLVLPQVVEGDDTTSFAGSALPAGGASRPPTSPGGLPGVTPTGLPSASLPGYGSGDGGGGARPTEPQAPATPTPAPDPTEEAYRAVRPGDCLAVYDTGYGDYNTRMPVPVDCGAGRAFMWVSAVRGSGGACPQGPGQNYLSYTSRGRTTALCLTRQYKAGYCLLAEQTGSGRQARMNAGLMTVVDCEAKRVPARYNRILHITGVYQAPANASAANCARVRGDRTSYWSWLVNGGRTLLCTMVYQG
ncbi:hypothetical protein IGW14_13970 [Streptomyces hygroscopicus subsp. hygroscopicus]|uniref:hypothetical protein n=1 Tax=Streptomyces hygroscopicus TaxID=1912 RepID=UPI001C654B57|nr:hypothetical protein [Streptomyces hygroscopicus]MBW8089103.1 hypothetical protein [Streptomyces hygroscopicus subsp. hygroscopicus]